MCQVLGVTRSAYYKYIANKNIISKDFKLITIIKSIFENSRKIYGARKIKQQLKRDYGLIVSRKKIMEIMKENDLIPVVIKKFKATTNSKHNYPVAKNLIKDMDLTSINQVWVTDITYIATYEGWLYLATVLDKFSRELIGYAMGDRITKELVKEALQNTLSKHKNYTNLICHSDRGVQYASHEYQAMLKSNNITCSMSAKGNPYDNAHMESFNAIIKKELIYQKDKYISREVARKDIFEYIETFYNSTRLHSSIGYITPRECRQQHIA